MENLMLLRDRTDPARGLYYCGTVLPDAAFLAFQGEERFQGRPAPVRVLFAMYPNYFHVVTTEDSGIRVLQDLRGKRVSTEVAGGIIEYEARVLLSAALPGFDPKLHEARAKAEEALGKVSLEAHAGCRVAELPLGDLKRLDVAMALVAEPKLLLLDEPLAGLSRAERRRMVDFIGELLRREGVTLLFTEHDTEAVLALADWVTVLHQGQVLAEGAPEEIRGDPAVRAAFLGGSA